MAQTVFAPWDDINQKPLIEFRGVTKRFGDFTAIDNLSIGIYEKEFFALLGPSGCGKTTLMRMLAGFEDATEGTILLSGQDIGPVPPNKRAVNMMFQSYALFPHLSVWENIAFGLKREKRPKPEIAARVDEMLELAGSSVLVFEHRHHLVDMLGGLCHELAASLGELAEDESWAKGQCEAMRVALEDGLSARSVKSVTELLRKTRAHQAQMRGEREQARTVLKAMFNQMLGELGELGIQTGRFHDSVGRYAGVIEGAESLESLTGVVRDIVEESRAVQALVIQAQQKLNAEHAKASDLSQRVNQLEDELRRLSNEVSTDQLTQVANRRGLLEVFERDCRRMRRSGGSLSVGLLDIDNFKRLNDELGHNVGDTALKSLAAAVSNGLRPEDTVARYGGEEFVVLLPDTEVDDAGDVLTRLQRSLSGGLFMHEHRNVMVTFSAGVTAYREGERIEESLERADRALFEAKRAGKNRTRSA